QVRANLTFARGRLYAYASDALALENEPRHLRFHLQMERRVLPPLVGQEVQKIPLRHERQKLAVHRQVTEVAEYERGLADLARELAHLRVGQLEELFDEPKLVEDFQRRRVHGVAAKI